jgi:hypothetical protein
MRRLLILAGMSLLFVPGLRAQSELDHVNIGVFADYFRSHATGTNMWGTGGRLGVAVFSHLKLEGEGSYDFEQQFNNGFTNTGGGTVTFTNSGVKVLHGLFGPKVELGHTNFRPFIEVKGGFVNYSFSNGNASQQFTTAVGNLRDQNMNGVVMPAAAWKDLSGRWDCDWMWVTKFVSTTGRITT